LHCATSTKVCTGMKVKSGRSIVRRYMIAGGTRKVKKEIPVSTSHSTDWNPFVHKIEGENNLTYCRGDRDRQLRRSCDGNPGQSPTCPNTAQRDHLRWHFTSLHAYYLQNHSEQKATSSTYMGATPHWKGGEGARIRSNASTNPGRNTLTALLCS
jgi:hypothetical protein